MKNKKGFTLVELIIVIGLLAVIAGMFAINMISTLKRNKNEEREVTINAIKSAADSYVTVNPERVEKLYSGYGYVTTRVL